MRPGLFTTGILASSRLSAIRMLLPTTRMRFCSIVGSRSPSCVGSVLLVKLVHHATSSATPTVCSISGCTVSSRERGAPHRKAHRRLTSVRFTNSFSEATEKRTHLRMRTDGVGPRGAVSVHKLGSLSGSSSDASPGEWRSEHRHPRIRVDAARELAQSPVRRLVDAPDR